MMMTEWVIKHLQKPMIEAGVPVVPGSVGSESFEQAQELARSFGYPVMLKATAGGGGKECVRSGKKKI
jgi:biotin carboxylase